jgi:hypothetical protein
MFPLRVNPINISGNLDEDNRKVLALVALGPDGIEYVCSGFERHYELASAEGRIDGRLRRRESV